MFAESVRAVATMALVLGTWSPPARAGGEVVTVARPEVVYGGDHSGVVLLAVCYARAAPTAAWTRVTCRVGGTQLVLRIPKESPVSPGAPVWNVSDTTLPGPFAVAAWEGGGAFPLEVCAYAEAAYDQPTGPPLVVSDGPFCRTVSG